MSDGIQGRHEVGGPQQTPEPPKEPKGVKKLFTDISTRLGGWVRQIGNSRFFSTYKVLPLSEEQADKLEQKKTRNFFQKFFGLGKASSNSSVQQAEEAPPSFQDLSITEKRKAVGNLHNRL